MSRPGEISERPITVDEASDRNAPGRYKIAIGVLLLSLVMVGLLWFQQANMLQLQNSQLSSSSSNLSQTNSDLYNILHLKDSQVLAGNQTIYWAAGAANKVLGWRCPCFQYSGYLHVKWTSTTSLSLRITQLELNYTTPTATLGDYRIPISSEGPFAASLIMAPCSAQSVCTGTYSAIYHY